jgi:hypothetical protein
VIHAITNPQIAHPVPVLQKEMLQILAIAIPIIMKPTLMMLHVQVNKEFTFFFQKKKKLIF